MNPWIAKAVILAASVVMIVIRAPHGRRSRGVKVARSCKGPREVAVLTLAWMGFLAPLIWIVSPVFSFADYSLRPWAFGAGVKNVNHRKHVFTEPTLVKAMTEQISQAAKDHSFAVLTYCFMPDHLHLLVAAEAENADLVSFAHAAKQRTGYEYGRMEKERLWQPGYFEHVVRDEELTDVVARYILENPVRAGLCIAPRNYAFSGSLVWSKEELDDLWFDIGTSR